MPDHIETKIYEGLIAHFETLSLPAGTEVAYPNVDFTPSGDWFVAVSVSRGKPINHDMGGGEEPERRGFFLVRVCRKANKGTNAATNLAGSIRDHFAFGTIIRHDGIEIWITEEPSVEDGEQGPVYYETPVVIPWRVYP